MSRKKKADAAGGNVGNEIAAEAARAEAEKSHVLKIQRQQELPCAISAEELSRVNAEHTATLDAIDQIAARKKAVAKDLRDEAADLNVTERRLRASCKAQTVNRLVACTCTYDYDAGTVTVARDDTGAVLETREMSDEERQVPLSMDEPAPVEVVFEDGPKLLALPPMTAAGANAAAEAGAVIVGLTDETRAAAVELLKKTLRASVSSFQRHLRIGFVAATAIMDALEREGIVGPPKPDGGPRDILLDLDAAAEPAGEADEDAGEAGET